MVFNPHLSLFIGQWYRHTHTDTYDDFLIFLFSWYFICYKLQWNLNFKSVLSVSYSTKLRSTVLISLMASVNVIILKGKASPIWVFDISINNKFAFHSRIYCALRMICCIHAPTFLERISNLIVTEINVYI